MRESAKKLRDNYAGKPGVPCYRRTFGLWMCLDKWYDEGLPRDVDLDKFFLFDEPGFHALDQLGWCESAFVPEFEEVQVEDRGEHEVVQDAAGRHVLYFKGRRHGFMPEFLDHPVKDMKTWEEKCKWRLDPNKPERYEDLGERMAEARKLEAEGLMIQQNLIGGYMYLRSLMGPEGVLYKVYDEPELIHDCMKTWLELADAVTAKHQEYVTFDEIYFAEDICYNHGPLISPDMIKEFLFPYYQQLINNIKLRQEGSDRHLYVQVDTDGFVYPVIDLYMEGIGMDVMGPFEAASGSDVLEGGRKWPELILYGGIDKRVLSQGRKAIDKELERVLPELRERGGYIPTCDHGVPPEVDWRDYKYFREKCVELGG